MTYQLNLCVLQDERAEVWGLNQPPKLRKIVTAFMATDSEIDAKMKIPPKKFDFFGKSMKMKDMFHSRPKSAGAADIIYVVMVFEHPDTRAKTTIKVSIEEFYKKA